jgi:hypothetical protein
MSKQTESIHPGRRRGSFFRRAINAVLGQGDSWMRRLAYWGALIILLALLVHAFVQAPSPASHSSWAWRERAWWFAPREIWGDKLGTLMEDDILDIALVPETDRLWICGKAGLLAYSDDGGHVWQRVPVDFPAEKGQGAPPEQSGPKDKEQKTPPDSKQATLDALKSEDGKPTIRTVTFFSKDVGCAFGDGVALEWNASESRWRNILNTPRDIRFTAAEYSPKGHAIVTGWRGRPFELSELVTPPGIRRDRLVFKLADGALKPLDETKFDGQTIIGSSTSTFESDIHFSDTLLIMAGQIFDDYSTLPESDEASLFDSVISGDFEKLLYASKGRIWLLGSELTGVVLLDDYAKPMRGAPAEAYSKEDYANKYPLAPRKMRWNHDGKRWALTDRSQVLKINNIGDKPSRIDIVLSHELVDDAALAGKARKIESGETWKEPKWPMDRRRAVYGVSPEQPEPYDALFPYRSLVAKGDNLIWVVGDGGRVVASTDGGASWKRLTAPVRLDIAAGQPWRFPAPIYYPVLALLFVTVRTLGREPKTKGDPEHEGIEQKLISDRPLQPGDPDPLEFGPVAKALSRFLRNQATQPPLTIAVTGDWGTGKSSLMALLSGDLRAKGYYPVWFNPWHHQETAHLLASLLENIIEQAVPPFFSRAGLAYRARLLWRRARKRWIWSLTIAAMAVYGAAFWSNTPPERREKIYEQIQTDAAKVFGGTENGETKSEKARTWLDKVADLAGAAKGPLSVVLAPLLLLLSIWRSLRSFGVNPGALLDDGMKRKAAELKDKTGFHHRFAKDFKEVTESLNPRTLLLVLDDLDRCSPETVVQVLEAVNFLVSAGDCFVVLGMATERVEGAVRAGFAEQGAALLRKGETLETFAHNYLEKLVNIEVPVPRGTIDQRAGLLVGAEHAASKQEDKEKEKPEHPRDVLRRWGQWLWKVTLCFALIMGVYGLYEAGREMAREKPQTEVKAEAAAKVAEAPKQQVVDVRVAWPLIPMWVFQLKDLVPAQAAPEIAKAATTLPEEPWRKPGPIAAADAPWLSIWRALALAAGLAAVAMWLKRDPEPLVVRSSPEYVTALQQWNREILRSGPTPRTLKRFLNHLRYLASRRGPVEEQRDGIFVRFLVWLRAKCEAARSREKERFYHRWLLRVLPAVPKDAEERAEIRDEVLVGLAALKFSEPKRDLLDLARDLESRPEKPPDEAYRRRFMEQAPRYVRTFENLLSKQSFFRDRE